jgi:hypothetical protein
MKLKRKTNKKLWKQVFQLNINKHRYPTEIIRARKKDQVVAIPPSK